MYRMEKYKNIVWKHGENNERSLKNNNIMNMNMIKDVSLDSVSLDSVSLDSVSLANVITNTNTSISINQLGEFRKGSNKREIVNNKLNERMYIGNIGKSPFNIENDYIKDLENQQKFMIPKSSYDNN